MKSLIISVLTLSILIGCWAFFYHYSDKNLHSIIDDCKESVMPAICSEDWTTAEKNFQKQYDKWHRYRKKALFFLDTQQINDADSCFAKTLMYIKAEDVSNSSGELLALQEQLKFLHENEGISFRNII